jgi:TolB-like protein
MKKYQVTSKSSKKAISDAVGRYGPGMKIVSRKRTRDRDGNIVFQFTFASHESKKKPLPALPLLAVAAAMIVVVILLLTLNHGSQSEDHLAISQTRIASRDYVESINLAVMPFVDLSSSGDQQYLCDGIADELINRLSTVSGLRVCARTTSFAYRESEQTIQEIGSELKIANLLEGSVQRSEGKLRINIKLVDASTGFQIWSHLYEGDAQSLFQLQDDICLSVTDKLKLELGLDEKRRLTKRYTDNIVADDYFKRGLYYQNQMTSDSLKVSINYFKDAISHDARFHLAQAHLSISYSIYASGLHEKQEEYFQRASLNAEAALEGSQELAEAYIARALVSFKRDFDSTSATRDLLKAIEINPRHPLAHFWYGYNLYKEMDFVASEKELRKTLEIEPDSSLVNRILANTLHNQGKTSEAIAHIRHLVSLVDSPPDQLMLFFLYSSANNEAEALKAFRSYIKMYMHKTAVKQYALRIDSIYEKEGLKGVVAEFLAIKSMYFPLWDHSMFNAYLGRKDEALKVLHRFLDDQHEPWWQLPGNRMSFASNVKSTPVLAELAGYAEYKRLLERLK